MTYRLQGVFTAIADPNRRAILDHLAGGDMTAGEIASKFDISRPAVVNHLRILEQSKLIRITARGRQRIHTIDPTGLKQIRDWMRRYEGFWDDKLMALKALAEAGAPQDHES